MRDYPVDSRSCGKPNLRQAAVWGAGIGILVLLCFVASPANAQTYATLLTFGGSNGAVVCGDLTLSGTTLYGMSMGGNGGSWNGNVFRIGANGSGYRNLLSLTGTGGTYPGWEPAGALAVSGTTLYGMTQEAGTPLDGPGSAGPGNIFSVGTDGSGYQNVFYFGSGTNSGVFPKGDLTLSGTTLYGVTSQGGDMGEGVAFRIGVNGSGYQETWSRSRAATVSIP